jgi:hypothetical protein
MAGILAGFGMLLCRLLMGIGLDSFIPTVCFGGDTTVLGYYAIIAAAVGVVAVCEVGYRITQSSAVIMVVLALSVVAAGSAAIIQYAE